MAILSDVEKGAFLDNAIDRRFSATSLDAGGKALVHEIVAGVVRWRSRLDWIIDSLSARRPRAETRLLLRISLYQLRTMRKAAHHVVKESVDFAASTQGRQIAGYINAVLRSYLREKDGLAYPHEPLARMAVLHSFPRWLVDRWVRRFGLEETEALLSHLNGTPRFSVRVNTGKASLQAVTEELEGMGISVSPGHLSPVSLTVTGLHRILRSPILKDAIVSIQDEASQLAVLALCPEAGETILDACSGLGTKTRHLADTCPEALVFSLDNNHQRLVRAGAQAWRIEGDGLAPPFKQAAFDAILLDAPCSSLGIAGKHPELKWRRFPEDIGSFAQLQAALLQSLWANLKPGGRLVYSVCSFEPEETVAIIDAFRRMQPCALENPLPFLSNMEYFLSVPHTTRVDGFFIARLRKL